MTDFRQEMGNNILNEIDDKLINYYFANSHLFERDYEIKISHLGFVKSNPHLFPEVGTDKALVNKKIDLEIQFLQNEMYFEMGKYMNKKRSEIFWNTVSEKNPVFTIYNPYFLGSALRINIEDTCFQSWLATNLYTK